MRVQRSVVQDQPERCRWKGAQVCAERLGRNVANSGTRCMRRAKIASTREAVMVCRRRYWAYRSELDLAAKHTPCQRGPGPGCRRRRSGESAMSRWQDLQRAERSLLPGLAAVQSEKAKWKE